MCDCIISGDQDITSGDERGIQNTMSKFGRLQEFNSATESVTAYLERVDLFFAANEIADDKKVAVFLSSVGATTYALLRDLSAPDKPADKTMGQLTTILKGHFNPKPLVIAERYQFHTRSQKTTESVVEYLASLRKLATYCEFEGFLAQALRDRFVCGLHNSAIQTKLLSEADLTLERAVEIAQSLESAEKSSKKLQGEDHSSISRISHQSHKSHNKKQCYRCGEDSHASDSCRFRDAVCRKCHRKGHIARVCRSGSQPSKSGGSHKTKHKVNLVQQKQEEDTKIEDDTAQEDDPIEHFTIFKVTEDSRQPIKVKMELQQQEVEMEVDTGAAVSLMSVSQYNKLFPNLPLQSSKLTLSTYTGEQLKLKGERKLEVKYGSQCKHLTIHVIEEEGPCLLGRDWLREIKLDWRCIGLLSVNKDKEKVDDLLSKYSNVFEEGLTTMNTFKAELHLKEGSTPKFCKARNVPFALRPAVEDELLRLEKEGVIKPVSHSQWAAPVVPVPKSDGHIRLCGDYKTTVNPALDVDKYPLPKPEDLFASLAGGKKFSKIDLTSAYQQVSLAEECEEFTTINTHKGLYRYTRLPFGIASAPAIFQQIMDTVLQGLPKVICYLDDVLVTGSTVEEHLKNLENVLKRLQQYNIKAKRSKCYFLCDSVEYLGHRIDADGLHTTDRKVAAIKKAPLPKNVQELRSFLGLVHYYGKFMPNLATLLHPLNVLLQAKSPWKWTQQCTDAFEGAKKLLISAPVLAHYDPSLPLKLAGDASSYGIGAVVSHVMPDGSERPVAFASRTLSPSEVNYSQLEKEALSLIFGLHRFHQYVYGRRFTLLTDHKPLVTLLGPKVGIPPVAAARLQRWALFLASHSYDIQYKRTHDHANADGLSRLPLKSQNSTSECLYTIGQIEALPTTVNHMAKETQRDPVLSRVYRYTISGWPTEFSKELKPFKKLEGELSTESDCVMWGTRVIVPDKLQEPLLKELHRGHPGITRMKAVARSYMWWPGMDQALEDHVKICTPCQANRHNPAPAPLHPWIWPSQPWQRVHLDFAGPFLGRMFLIVVDAHSKWPEVIEMTTTTAIKTVRVVRQLFAHYGLPLQVVTDNGPQFVSEEFKQFLKLNGVKHITSSPYHPATNGLAERFVQSFKNAMSTGAKDITDVSHRMAEFLLAYRSTPHATTMRSPSELFLGRKIRTRLDLILPNCEAKVFQRQAEQKKNHDRSAHTRQLSTGERVMARNYRDKKKRWLPGTVVQKLGPLTYSVQLDTGMLWRRHIDQLRLISDKSVKENSTDLEHCVSPTPVNVPNTDQPQQDISPSPQNSPDRPTAPERRYPTRDRNPPQRFAPVVNF